MSLNFSYLTWDAENIHSITVAEAAHLFQAAFVWLWLLSRHYKSARIIYPIPTRVCTVAHVPGPLLYCLSTRRALLLILSLLTFPEPCPQIPSHPHNQRHFPMAYRDVLSAWARWGRWGQCSVADGIFIMGITACCLEQLEYLVVLFLDYRALIS